MRGCRDEGLFKRGEISETEHGRKKNHREKNETEVRYLKISVKQIDLYDNVGKRGKINYQYQELKKIQQLKYYGIQ